MEGQVKLDPHGEQLMRQYRELLPTLQQLADEAGNSRGANTIMFGVMLALGITKLPEEAFKAALSASFAKKPKLIPMNIAVLDYACKWVRENVK